jgi:hypothetical protein
MGVKRKLKKKRDDCESQARTIYQLSVKNGAWMTDKAFLQFQYKVGEMQGVQFALDTIKKEGEL